MRGLIHIYCGDGKGKTTAAMGLSLRAAGRGKRVLIVQFLKSHPTGELEILKALPQVRVLRGKLTDKFTSAMNDAELLACKTQHDLCLYEAIRAAEQDECDLLVLDEVMAALNKGLLDEDALKALALHKPESLELVLTGRNPPDYLIEAADYVSEIKKVKHPYDRGIAARDGIER